MTPLEQQGERSSLVAPAGVDFTQTHSKRVTCFGLLEPKPWHPLLSLILAALVLTLAATLATMHPQPARIAEPYSNTTSPSTPCSSSSYFPIPSTVSVAAQHALQSWGGPRTPPTSDLGQLEAVRAWRAASNAANKPWSDRYRQAFVLEEQSLQLGGVPTVLITPRGLRPGGGGGGDGTGAGGNSSQGTQPSEPLILYLHGGAYVLFSPQDLFHAFAPLAAAAGMRLAALDYRLAPEHPFPAALDDAVAAYRALLAAGHAPRRLALAGASAGGGLAAALLLRAAAQGLPLPGAVVLASPWAELRIEAGDSHHILSCSDPILNPEVLTWGARHYGGGADLANPLISPANADFGAAAATAAAATPPRNGTGSPGAGGSNSGGGDGGVAAAAAFPPTLIVAGGREMLLSDALRLHARLRAGGVASSLSVYEGMWHDFSAVAPGPLDLPEAAQGVQEMAAFLKRHLDV